jgi:hypothetical protein
VSGSFLAGGGIALYLLGALLGYGIGEVYNPSRRDVLHHATGHDLCGRASGQEGTQARPYRDLSDDSRSAVVLAVVHAEKAKALQTRLPRFALLRSRSANAHGRFRAPAQREPEDPRQASNLRPTA